MTPWPPTTNRLDSSRLIKVGLIGVGALLVIYFGNSILIAWIAWRIMHGASAEELDGVVTALNTGTLAAGVTTIVTAVIARYGLREVTQNLRGGGGDAETKQTTADRGTLAARAADVHGARNRDALDGDPAPES
jgi:hypothetical protein